MTADNLQRWYDKIGELPAEELIAVAQFVDQIADRVETREWMAASAMSFARIWDSEEDAIYDTL